MHKLTSSDIQTLAYVINIVTQEGVEKSTTILQIGATLTVEKQNNVIECKIIYPPEFYLLKKDINHEQEKDSNVSKEADPCILSEDATDSNIPT